MRVLFLFCFGCLYFAASAGTFQDSAILSASNKYKKPSLFRQIFLGKNYRETWELPVKMPVFDIRKEQGGLTITELGGGQQTKSLRMKDKDSVEWVLRTVDKDVELALPKILRNTIAERIVQDMVSGAHPYAPLTVAHMAKALKLNAPDPQLFYIPDDPAFGKHRALFAHTVCMLERTEPTPDNSDTKSTETLYEKLKEENDHLVDDTTLLKARLLDMLIADWDRHQDQWKWGIRKDDGESYYYPIPRDRDQAFFYSNGLLVKLVRPFTMKHLVGFTESNKKLLKLNRKSYSFDKQLLNQLEEEDWKRIITDFQRTLNDPLLEAAVLKLPTEVYRKDGYRILQILKARRDGLMEYGMKYYDFLSKEVTVSGSDKEEIVKLTNEGEDLKVTVLDKKSNEKRYERKFQSGKTKAIQIDLRAGDDEFIVEDNVSSTIKVSLKGGDGKDKIKEGSRLKVSMDKDTREESK